MASYLRPTRLEDALDALARDAANLPTNPLDRLTLVAGATDFYPAATTRQAWFQPHPQNILDITGLSELRGISEHGSGFRIGALTTWSDLIAARLPAAFDALKQASRQVGGVQIQNRGSLAGNLCNASPAADGVPPLLALDAEVELTALDGIRRLPLSRFILGNRRTALRPDEMLTAIHLPRPGDGERSSFLKLGARSYLVISIASVAANIVLAPDGSIRRVRIAVGACSAVPQRLTRLEETLARLSLPEAILACDDNAFEDLTPMDDIRATASYRRQAVRILVKRALADLCTLQERAA